MSIESILIFFSSALMILGTYFIWFSRYNIPNHLLLATIVVAYLIPLFMTDVLSAFPVSTVRLYAYILAVGSVSYFSALFFGYKFVPFRRLFKTSPFFNAPAEYFVKERYRFLVIIAAGSLIVMALCWMYIGVIPMLSDDPFTAKFFKGQYQDAYMKVALPYRMAQTAQITIFPIIVVLWYVTRRKLLLVLSLLMMLFFAFALTRSLVFSGIVTLVALFAARKRLYLFGFIAAYVVVMAVGSAAYFLISLLFDTGAFIMANAADATIWTVIAAGAPDVQDQLTLLQSFERHGVYTLGRTFYGGLVPGQYYWNPSAWSLYISNETDDISDVISGGFRAPVAMWGYFAFGWAGVVVIPFLSGVIVGASTRYVRAFVSNKNLLTSVLALSFYTVVLAFFSGFYVMSMYSIPSCILLIVILYKFGIKKGNYPERVF